MIYKITNLIDGKTYIGMTSLSVEKRFERHCRNAKSGSDTYLYRAMRKHGIDNFKSEYLCEGMDKEEIEMISKHKSEYNETPGGTGGDTSKSENFKKSMKNRRNLSDNFGDRFKGKKHTDESRKLQSEKRKTWYENASPELKQQKSQNITGENNGMYGKVPKNAIKVFYNNKEYNSKSAICKETGHSWKKLIKLGAIIL
jgi:group I intron endonuclease